MHVVNKYHFPTVICHIIETQASTKNHSWADTSIFNNDSFDTRLVNYGDKDDLALHELHI